MPKRPAYRPHEKPIKKPGPHDVIQGRLVKASGKKVVEALRPMVDHRLGGNPDKLLRSLTPDELDKLVYAAIEGYIAERKAYEMMLATGQLNDSLEGVFPEEDADPFS